MVSNPVNLLHVQCYPVGQKLCLPMFRFLRQLWMMDRHPFVFQVSFFQPGWGWLRPALDGSVKESNGLQCYKAPKLGENSRNQPSNLKTWMFLLTSLIFLSRLTIFNTHLPFKKACPYFSQWLLSLTIQVLPRSWDGAVWFEACEAGMSGPGLIWARAPTISQKGCFTL